MKTLPRVSTEMSLHVLAYNLKRVINLVGTRMIIATIRAEDLSPEEKTMQ